MMKAEEHARKAWDESRIMVFLERRASTEGRLEVWEAGGADFEENWY
jgi:hypothetical protein